jgi:Cytochrome P460
MLTQIKIGVFVIVLGISLVVAMAVHRAEGAGDEFRFDAAKLKDRTSWIQVNAEPYYISSVVDGLCALPTAAHYEHERKSNPHSSTYITVYVNKVARKAMFAKDAQRFPEGSIIVKQKIGTQLEGRKPLLYTLMKKREPGYNPNVGDWEFSVVGPDGKQLQATGKLENCESCHKGKSESDFVFRPYVKL